MWLGIEGIKAYLLTSGWIRNQRTGNTITHLACSFVGLPFHGMVLFLFRVCVCGVCGVFLSQLIFSGYAFTDKVTPQRNSKGKLTMKIKYCSKRCTLSEN